MLEHIAGVKNTIADGISRWEDRSTITADWLRMLPDVAWHEQVMNPEGLKLCTSILASSSPEDPLRARLEGPMHQPSVLGAFFALP